MGAPARVPQSGTRPRQIQTQLQLFPQPAQPLQYRFCSRRTGSKVPPFTSRSHVHTQRFAFRAPEVHDESVKMSSTTVGRSSALPPALQAARPCAADDATSIVILPALSDFCEGRPAPLLHAGPAAGGPSPASPWAARLQNHQFLFDTNERFSPNTNFATQTKQSTSFFLFDTNDRSLITNHQSLITTLRQAKTP